MLLNFLTKVLAAATSSKSITPRVVPRVDQDDISVKQYNFAPWRAHLLMGDKLGIETWAQV